MGTTIGEIVTKGEFGDYKLIFGKDGSGNWRPMLIDSSGNVQMVLTNLEKAEDAAHASGDKGIMTLAVRKDNVGSLCGAEGDYTPLILNEHGVLRTQAQQHYHIDECEAITGWSVLGNDTINLAVTTNHVCGTFALEFDKVNGAANTKIAGIQKTITSFDFTPYHKGGGFALVSCYLSSLTSIDYCFLRLGTDASNYTEWRCDADDLDEGWNFCRHTACKPSATVGNGWNSAAITYVAVGVAFEAETDELADIAVDHLAINTGLMTSIPVEAAKNINLLKIKNKVVDVGAGNVGTGTQRITVAGDDANLAKLTAWDDGSDRCKVKEQNLDGDGLIQQSQHLKGYNYGTSAWDKVGITAAHELKISMTGLDAYILKSMFNANTIIAANSDDTPAALTIDEQRILGRITSGNITGLTATQVKTLLGAGSASGLATLDASSLLVESLNADKISAGNIAAARMSTNIVAAIAGLDPVFTTLTFDGATAILRDVALSLLSITGSNIMNRGGGIHLYDGLHASHPGKVRIDIGDYGAGQTPNSMFDMRYLSDGTSSTIIVIDKNGNITTVARGDFSAGVRLGTAQDANHFDDGSHGAASTTMYIGNKTINTTFTGCHHYQLGDLNLQLGESVKLINHKIYRTTKKQDKSIIGIYWGITDYKDSLGNIYIENEIIDEEYNDEESKKKIKKVVTNKPIRISDKKSATKTDFAYSVAVLGDSYEEHDKQPLTGAWVTINVGVIEEGDFLCSSAKAGYLEKQSDDIRHNYTKGIAREKITKNTKEAYIELI